jgi:Helitron helicase-like domain at N-terminus
MYRRDITQPELACGALTQMYVVESWIRVQANDLNYLRRHLPQQMMITSRRHLNTLLEKTARQQNYQVGRSFVLPKTFRGGDEYMRTLYRHCIESIRVSAGLLGKFVSI